MFRSKRFISIPEFGSMQGWHVYCRILYIPMLECGYGVVALKTKFAFGFLFHVTEICINMLLSISIVTSLVNTIPLCSLLKIFCQMICLISAGTDINPY